MIGCPLPLSPRIPRPGRERVAENVVDETAKSAIMTLGGAIPPGPENPRNTRILIHAVSGEEPGNLSAFPSDDPPPGGEQGLRGGPL